MSAVLEVSEKPGLSHALLQFDKASFSEFTSAIKESLLEKKTEYRLALPQQGWTLYFKLRAGPTRLMLARPQTSEWVGTISVSDELAVSLAAALDRILLQEQKVFSVGTELAPVHSLSNFELSLGIHST